MIFHYIITMANFILPYCAYLRAFVIRIPNAYEGQIPYQNPNPNLRSRSPGRTDPNRKKLTVL